MNLDLTLLLLWGVWCWFSWFSRKLAFLIFCGQVFKSKRWMPWHLEPKKDVGICDKPGGVDNRTVIPGCPNGETPPGARGDLVIPHLNT